MTDLATIESDIETLYNEFQAALGPISALITVLGPFLPAKAIEAVTILKAVNAAAPTIIADAKKLTADVEAALAAISPATPAAA